MGRKPIDDREPLRDFVAKAIKKAIVTGRLKPGQRLVEERLADELGVSRNPVREAIRALASEGLIDVAPRRGARVTLLSRQEALEMIEVRAALEGLNAKLAARHRPEHLIEQLKAVLADGRSRAARGSGTPRDFVNLNAKYHDLLAQAGTNSALRDVMRIMRERTASVFAPLSLKRAVENWEEHAAILQAVIAGDEELAELLASRHVLNTGEAAAQAPHETSEPPRSDDDQPAQTKRRKVRAPTRV
ncbi:MAG: GntR family transcriptional regulator [Hyphomicrobiales bacterium]|nr:MAG: GntR family transcriptional regulator [Hyphomicrobiales bacterium]